MAQQSIPIKEIIPKSGLLFQEITLQPVLCKPKIMPLKSVTLEKLEKMQKQAQDKVLEMEKQQQQQQIVTGGRPMTSASATARPGTSGTAMTSLSAEAPNRPLSAEEKAKADVWRAEDDESAVAEAEED